jgi:hypothetical protein
MTFEMVAKLAEAKAKMRPRKTGFFATVPSSVLELLLLLESMILKP